MTLPAADRQSPWGTLALLCSVVVAITIIYCPGHMSADTLTQIEQVRNGQFADHHAPALTSLWRIAWLAVPGTWYVLGGTIAAFVFGVYALLRIALSRWTAAAATALLAFSPYTFGYLGVLSRDTWFLALTLGTFGCLVRSVDATGRRRHAYLGGALACGWLAMAARQNAFPVGLVASFMAVTILLRGRPGWSSLLRRILVAVGVTAALGGSQLVYQAVVLDVRRTSPEQAIFLYDLINISLRENEVLLPPQIFPSGDLDRLREAVGTRSIDAALFSRPPLIPYPVGGDLAGDIQRSWRKAVGRHPMTYIDACWDLWTQQIGLTDSVQWVTHPFIDPNNWGYKPTFPALERRANSYVTWFAANRSLDGGLIYRPWIFLLIDLAGLLYVAHGDARRRLLGGLALSVLLYEVTIFFGAMGNQYRFTFPAVTVGLVVAVVGSRDLVALRRQRRGVWPGVPVSAEPESPDLARATT